jgi:glutathione S-transferase
MFDLYTAATTNGQRASIMLEELGLPYRAVRVELGGDNAKKPEAMMRANPIGAIPVLIDHDRGISLSQSFAIMQYLCEREGRFLPPAGAARALVLQWMAFVMTDVISATHALYMLSGPMQAPADIVAQYEARLMRHLGLLDARLAEARHLAGDEISMADLALYPTAQMRRPLLARNPRLPHLEAWLDATGARPAVARGMAVP